MAPPRPPAAHRIGGGLPRGRVAAGLALGVLLLSAGTPALAAGRSPGSLGVDLLLYLLTIVVVALVGGLVAALVTSLAAAFIVDYWFVPPLHRLTVDDGTQVLALLVFVTVGLLVSAVVGDAARQTNAARRAGAEAETLATLAAGVMSDGGDVDSLLTRVMANFHGAGAELAALDGDASRPLAKAGDTSGGIAGRVSLGRRVLTIYGDHPVTESDRRVLVAFTAHAAVADDQQRFREIEAELRQSAEGERLRSALLSAVSHDLRTPLGAAKLAVSGLLDPEVSWAADQRTSLLRTADESLDALTAIIDDLLDMSRIQAGVLPVHLTPTAVADVAVRAVDAVADGRTVVLELDDDGPWVLADQELLERILANIVQNALRYSPVGEPPSVGCRLLGDRVETAVVDHGPGLAKDQWSQAFEPFQRLDDRTPREGSGVGLGLALARGFAEAMGGTLAAADTPGGGLSLLMTLPRASEPGAP